MFLQYKNKKSELDILKKARTFKALSLDEKQSTLIKGDNFIVLSKLLKQYKSKIDLIYIDHLIILIEFLLFQKGEVLLLATLSMARWLTPITLKKKNI